MSLPSSTGSQAFADALSTRRDLSDAVAEAGDQIAARLDGSPTATVVFVTPDHRGQWDDLAQLVTERLDTELLLGCSGEGVIAAGREVEAGPALAVWAARLPAMSLLPLELEYHRTAEGGAIVGWPDELIGPWPDDATLLLLAEPFTFPAEYLLERVNDDHPHIPIVGGMASGAARPGDNRLFLGGRSRATGAVAWMIRGAVPVHTVVSQGCRPIGEPFVVTAAERNLIKQLGGRPALEQLQQVFSRLPTHEQELVQRGLHVGRVVDEYREEFQMGDFLIRNVLGIDRESGSISVGDFIRPGQTIQFHLRDERTASAELQQLLAAHRAQHASQAGLLFSCNGRGTRMFSHPDHDARTVAETLGAIPLAGFFAQGEIGPVGKANFLHGFTASLALFDEVPS
jgi:small ligand-binding sensory domain FIST